MRASTLVATVLVILTALSSVPPSAAQAGGREYFVYIGTYTRMTSKGVYGFRFNPATGAVTSLGLMAEIPSPSFMAAHPNGRFLYAANEREYNEVMGNKVSTFAIDRQTGRLTLLKRTPSSGDGQIGRAHV